MEKVSFSVAMGSSMVQTQQNKIQYVCKYLDSHVTNVLEMQDIHPHQIPDLALAR